jgi:hypothetical protein
MMYFSNFPKTMYQVRAATFNRPAEYVVLTDITRNVRFKKDVLDNIAIYDLYIMTEGETIEQVSERLYGSPHYHWVLMLYNDRFNYVADLPLTSQALDNHINAKYNVTTIVDGEPVVYIDYQMALTPQTLIVDIQTADDGGKSTDFTETVRVVSRANGAFVGDWVISSRTVFDHVLQINIKRFYVEEAPAPYTSGVYLDTALYRLDWGSVAQYTIISAYDYETVVNDKKRELRVLSELLLQTVLSNFKDLM